MDVHANEKQEDPGLKPMLGPLDKYLILQFYDHLNLDCNIIG